MDNSTDSSQDSFGKELAKTLAITTASSAGFWGGLIIAGSVYSALKNRKSQETTETPEVV